MNTAADWCRRTQLLLGREKDTGRTLLGTDWACETVDAPLLSTLLVLEVMGLLMAVVGMSLGAVGSLR